jgi:hypothetical protein
MAVSEFSLVGWFIEPTADDLINPPTDQRVEQSLHHLVFSQSLRVSAIASTEDKAYQR